MRVSEGGADLGALLGEVALARVRVEESLHVELDVSEFTEVGIAAAGAFLEGRQLTAGGADVGSHDDEAVPAASGG